MKDAAGTVMLATVIAVAGLFGAFTYGRSFKEPAQEQTVTARRNQVLSQNVNVLKIPARIKVPLGEPTIIPLDTKGEVIIWQAQDQGLEAKSLGDDKNVWVWVPERFGPGEYRMTAYTSVDNIPTVPVTCIVEAYKKEDDKK